MSKLTQIRQALESNPEVVISNLDEENYLPERTAPMALETYCHKIIYSIVPKNSIYDIDQLQSFMEGLIPDLEPNYRSNFARTKWRGGSIFKNGELSFTEKIGEQRTTTKKVLTLTDEELLNFNGFIDGKQTIKNDVTRSYDRRIVIRVYPNELIREHILSNIDKFGSQLIPLKYFRRYTKR